MPRPVEAAAIVSAGRPFPARSLVLTFDDGLASVHERRCSLLVELGWTATVFVTSGRSEAARRRLAGSGRGRAAGAARSGVSIGATRCRIPTSQGRRRQRRGRAAGREGAARGAARVAIRSFAYPFGRYDARSRAAAESSTTAPARTRWAPRGDDPWLLPRSSVVLSRRGCSGGSGRGGRAPHVRRGRGGAAALIAPASPLRVSSRTGGSSGRIQR